MQSPTWIRARELDQWAKSPQAKVLLPELIGRLVRATVPPEQLSKCDFAAEAETHRPGFDGTTVTAQATLYVPAGIVCWELGCDAKPEQKAQNDYEKRIAEHEARVKAGEADDISQATFIAVTACDWHAKKAAVRKGKARRPGKLPGKRRKRWAEWRSGRKLEQKKSGSGQSWATTPINWNNGFEKRPRSACGLQTRWGKPSAVCWTSVRTGWVFRPR